ncbi:MAG: pre-peptidase C-terminal domain-containing protein, partial [Planctomycetota bacterium]
MFASADNDSINFSTLTGTVNSPTIANLSDTTVSNRASPPLATQPDPVGTELDSGGNRIRSQVVFQNGSYYGVNGIDVNGTAAIRLFTISAGLTLQRDQAIFGNGDRDFIYPSIDVNNNNDLVIGFTVTGPSNNPSGAFVAAKDPGAGNNYSFPNFFFSFAGADTYESLVGTRNRWGDYSATHFDPEDQTYFWTFQEYAKGNNPSGNTTVWGTGIREASPDGVVPGRLPRTLTFAEGSIVPYGPTGSSDDVQSFDAFINFRGDVDSFYLNSDNSIRGNGQVTIVATDLGDIDIDTVLGLYDADTGVLEAVNDNAIGDDSRIIFTLPGTSSRYIVAVGNKLADTLGITPTGDVDIDVAWNGSFSGANVALDGDGDGTANVILSPSEDSDFYTVVAPNTATGSVTITLSPEAGLNGDLYVFDDAGNLLGSSNSATTGNNETVQLLNIVPGTRLNITVQSSAFLTTGNATLSVDFVTAPIPGTPSQPDLTDASDSGISNTDNITNDTTPTF